MRCWICGQEGNTGEHLPKASDLKSYFGRISQDHPIYFHSKVRKNIPVKSVKSDRLKSKARICSHCNNHLTQPYDKAWQLLSEYLRFNWTSIQRHKRIRLSKVFPNNTRFHAVDMHLYFVKLFGCLIAEHDIPIDISQFSNSLVNRIPHKSMYIAVGPLAAKLKSKCITVTDLKTVIMEKVGFEEKAVFASWLYVIGNIAINIIMNEVANNSSVLMNAWHPNVAPSKVIILKDYLS